jgi:hypothetical protein
VTKPVVPASRTASTLPPVLRPWRPLA